MSYTEQERKMLRAEIAGRVAAACLLDDMRTSYEAAATIGQRTADAVLLRLEEEDGQ